MINLSILCTVVLVGMTLLIGLSVLIYQHYRYRRKSVDWGNIERYDTPLEIPPGSNNSSFRSYKYSQLVGKQDGQRKQSQSHLYPTQRQCLSLGDIERDGRSRGNRSSTKSCPPGVFTTPSQEFRLNKEQQLVQPYYYYRQILVHPSATKARHSLPEVVRAPPKSTSASHSSRSRSPQRHRQHLSPHSSYRQKSQSPTNSQRRHKLSVDYCIEHVPIPSSKDSTEGPKNNSSFRGNKFQKFRPTRGDVEGNSGEEIEDESTTIGLLYPNQSHRRLSHNYLALGAYQLPQEAEIVPELEHFKFRVEREGGLSDTANMLTHQSRSLPTGPPIPGARLNRTYSISSQGHIESAVRKGHRGSSPAIRTFNPDGFSFDVTSPPDSPPPTYHGSRSPSPLYVRAASLDINRTGSPCPSPLGDSNFHVSATQHSSHSMDAYPAGKAPMLSPNSLCVRRASRCLSPLFIPPISPKSPTDGNSSSSQPSASSTGPLSPMLGSLQLDLYLKKDVTIFLDANQRITNLMNNEEGKSGNGKKSGGENGVKFPFPAFATMGKSNGHGPHSHHGSLGRLHFRLKYDLDKSDLHIHVIEAHDLAKGDQGGFNDPYIRVFISPEVDNRKRETTIHRNESDPFFDEHFKFPVSQEDLKEKSLMLQVLDFDKYSRNDVVGEVSFALEDFDITTNLEVWAAIVQNKTPSGEKQEILISLSYLPSAERLTVVLLKARNLHPPDNKDTIDPFVKVYLLGGGKRQKKKKTTARKNSNNPLWNEAFTFSISSANLTNCSIEISVLDQSNDLMGSHALIGSCMIGPHQKGSELTHWQEMTHNLRQTITMWHVLT